MSARIGIGFDVHRLVPGRPCRLGGIELPHPAGPLGHSDGDAVLHAVADALLGAAGLEDLGTLFSDQDARWKDADSAALGSRPGSSFLGCSMASLIVVSPSPDLNQWERFSHG